MCQALGWHEDSISRHSRSDENSDKHMRHWNVLGLRPDLPGAQKRCDRLEGGGDMVGGRVLAKFEVLVLSHLHSILRHKFMFKYWTKISETAQCIKALASKQDDLLDPWGWHGGKKNQLPRIILIFLLSLFLFLVCFCFVLIEVSLCDSGWPGTHYVDQGCLKLRDIHLPLSLEYWD